MNDFILTLLFGAAIIVVFSWDQFKRPTYEASQDLMRMIDVLAPPDLRKRDIYLRSYVFYTAVLVTIYVIACVYATGPIVQLLGLVSGTPAPIDGLTEVTRAQEDAVERTVKLTQSPVAPLVVSLMMVGLAPASPILQRFEEKIRLTAHRLSGIPGRLVAGSMQLKTRSLHLSRDGVEPVIDAADLERLDRFVELAGRMGAAGSFLRDVEKILAYRAWFVDGAGDILLNRSALSPTIARKESQLKEDVASLLLSLDALTRHAGATPSPGNGNGDGGLDRDLFARYVTQTGQLASEVCAMLMLYLEHGAIKLTPSDENAAASAANALYDFVRPEQLFTEEKPVVGPLWWRATVAASVVAFVWGLALGNLENTQPKYLLQNGALFTLSAFLIYAPAALTALVMHDYRSQHGKGDWPNLFTTHWARAMGPVSGVLIAAAIISLLCAVSLNLYYTATKFGLDIAVSDFWSILGTALMFDGPRYMLGPILALGIIASIDAARAEADAAKRARYRTIALVATPLAMMIWAVIARGLSAQYLATTHTGGQAAPLHIMFVSDWMMALAGLRAGLIGVVVIYVCQRTLGADDNGAQAR